MPDVPLKPEDWKKFSQGLEAQTADHSGGGSLSPWVQAPLDYMKGQFVGAGKAAAGLIPESIAPTAVHEFATSPGDPSSIAERAGESVGNFGANVLPFAYAPGFGIASKLGNVALAARTAGNIGMKGYSRALKGAKWLEGVVKGTEGGAAEAAIHTKDQEQEPSEAVERGAVTGGTTAAELMAARLAYEALPLGAKAIVKAGSFGLTAGAAGMLLVDELGHHHWVPHALLYGLAGPLLGVAAGATKVSPGVIGAASERAGQLSGYEPGGSATPADEQSQDEIIGQ